MTRQNLLGRPLLLAALALLGAGCQLFQTGDDEQVLGRGATAFDPYAGSRSGAIRLGLQWYNGCSVFITGEPVNKGPLDIPYPAQCQDIKVARGSPANNLVAPDGNPMTLIRDMRYFLGQLTFMESVLQRHTQYPNPAPALQWMSKEGRFKNLDWRGAGLELSRYEGTGDTTTNHVFLYGNAAWMLERDDSFLVEVVGSDGVVTSSQTYAREDFFAESTTGGHSQYSWRVEGIAKPTFPGDPTVRNPPGRGPIYRSTFRMDMVGSANPFKTFSVPTAGPAVLRVTWSQLPEEPFLFPVQVVDRGDLPRTCFEGEEPVACDFGLEILSHFSPPASGEGFYEPGERFTVRFEIQDSTGHRLHAKDSFPSYLDYLGQNNNGLVYYHPYHTRHMLEQEISPRYQVVGPIKNLRLPAVPGEPLPFTALPDIDVTSNSGAFIASNATIAQSAGFADGLQAVPTPTQASIDLPADAEPGTYVLLAKMNRQWMGERVSKARSFAFQVGTKQVDSTPQRVGNCQICHRGVLSLENARHGFSVDDVETCKGCHASNDDNFKRLIHQVHVSSPKYQFRAGDCTVCHLTRESAITPSLSVCSTCHLSVHGNDYFALEFAPITTTPNRFSTCAQACHVGVADTTNRVPSSHILPGPAQ